MSTGTISNANKIIVDYMNRLPKAEPIVKEREFTANEIVKCPDCGLYFDNRDSYDRSFHKKYHTIVFEGVARGHLFSSVDKAKAAYEDAEKILWECEDTYVQMQAAEVMLKAKWTLYYLLNIQLNCAGSMIGMLEYRYEFVKVNKDYFPDIIYTELFDSVRNALKKAREARKAQETKNIVPAQFSVAKLIPLSQLAYKKEDTDEEFYN